MKNTPKNTLELNTEIKGCSKCRLWQTRNNSLCGEGNLDARLMMVAQAPGENEDREGRMFIGPSGVILNELLGEAGVDREEIYMTNLVKCMLPKYRKPKEDEIKACSQYLDQEIELIRPATISPLGYYATRYILEKYDIAMPDSRSQFPGIYGELILVNSLKIYALPHPAALLYDDSRRSEMVEKYRKLKVLLGDCKWFPVCPLKRLYERGLIDGKWIELYCKGDWERCMRYEMEERGEPHSDFMLPDNSRLEDLSPWVTPSSEDRQP